MSFRPLQAHPLFLPAMAIMATIVALMVLANANRPAPNVSLPTFGSSASEGETISNAASERGVTVPSAQIARVELARDAGGPDAVIVSVKGEQLRLLLDVDTRILVPYNGRNVVAGPESLENGTVAGVELDNGETLRNGAHVAQIVVAGASANNGTEA